MISFEEGIRMKWYWFSLLVLLMLLPAGCGQNDNDDTITANSGTFAPPITQAAVVTLDELAANPAGYLDQLIQITGRYQQLPQLVCNSNARPSPASWSVVNNDFAAEVGGFDNQLNELIPDGLSVTVQGIWQRWRGEVGCGKQAQPSTVWFLSATNIVDPSPLVRITLTPGGIADLPDDLLDVTPDITSTIEFLDEVVDDLPTPIGPPDTPPTETPTLPDPPTATSVPLTTVEPTPTIEPTATTISDTPIPTETIAAGDTPLPTETIAAGDTPVPSDTPAPGDTPVPTDTPLPTDTPNPDATPTFTPTPGGSNLVEKDEATFRTLIANELAAGDLNYHMLELEAGDLITISLVMRPDLDPTLAIWDANDTVVHEQNNSPAGETERIDGIDLPAGTYKVIIAEANANEADYGLTLDSDSLAQTSSFIIDFPGPVAYGVPRTHSMPENRIDFWHFYGTAGDVIVITAAPDANSDLLIVNVMTPGLETMLEADIDDGGDGVAESVTITLTETGLYLIRIEEFFFEPSDYSISVNLSS